MPGKEFRLVLLFSTMLITAFVVAPIYCLEKDQASVHSIGYIVSGGVEFIARSGSVEDIQQAIDEAIHNGTGNTVYIPEGEWTFNATGSNHVTIQGTRALTVEGAGMYKTNLTLDPDLDRWVSTTMFDCDDNVNLVVRDITFVGRTGAATKTGDVAIDISNCSNFRITNSSFHDMGSVGVAVNDRRALNTKPLDLDVVSFGVVDHCSFINIYKPAAYEAKNGYGYGVQIARGGVAGQTTPYDRNPWSHFGNYRGSVFVEDCYFKNCRHAAMSGGGGVYVFRHNIVEWAPYSQDAMFTGHGSRDYGGPWWGMRAWEIYNNTLNQTNPSTRYILFLMENGAGIIANNTIDGVGDNYGRWRGLYKFEQGDTTLSEVDPQGAPKYVFIYDNDVQNDPSYIYQISDSAANADPTIRWCMFENGTDEPDSWYCDWIDPSESYWDYQTYPYPHPLVSGSNIPAGWAWISDNATSGGDLCLISSHWRDFDGTLANYAIKHNLTGVESWINGSDFVNGWVNKTITLSNSDYIWWQVYVKDSGGDWISFGRQFIDVK